MNADEWVKMVVLLVTALGGGGGVAAAFRWILQPYKDALQKAETQSNSLMLQISNKQSIIDELVESHTECEVEHSDKDAWISSAHSWITSASTWMKNHGAELPEMGNPPPRRERKAINRANYLRNLAAQNTANAEVSQRQSSNAVASPPSSLTQDPK